jgi:hypothetical protein
MSTGASGRNRGLGLLGNAPPGFHGNSASGGLQNLSDLVGNQHGLGNHDNHLMSLNNRENLVTSFQNQLCVQQSNHSHHGQQTNGYHDKVSNQTLSLGNSSQNVPQHDGNIQRKSLVHGADVLGILTNGNHSPGVQVASGNHGNNDHSSLLSYPSNKPDNGLDNGSQGSQHISYGNHCQVIFDHRKTNNLTGNPSGSQGSLQYQKQNGFHNNNYNNNHGSTSTSTQMLLNSFSQLQRGGSTVLTAPLGGARSNLQPNSINNGVSIVFLLAKGSSQNIDLQF